MQNQSSKGLAADIRTLREKIGGFWSALSGHSSDYTKVAYFNNPNSLNDNALRWAWLFLLGASVYTLYTGFEYHISVFQNTYKASLFFLLGEAAKITLGLLFLRSLFSGLYFRGLPHFILGLATLLFVIGAFWWSIDITADKYAKDKGAYEYGDALQQKTDYKALTADIDAQLASANNMAKAGSTSTWKGKITGDGLEVMKDNARATNKLLKQREMMIQQAMRNDSVTLAGKMAVIADNMKQRNRYGGIAEIVVGFALFFIALLELICYRENKHLIESDEKHKTASQSNPLFKIFQVAPTPTPSVITGQRPTIGFKQYEEKEVITETVVTPVISVITPENQKEIRNTETVISDTIKQYLQRLNMECSNYERRNGKRDTVIKRLRQHYDAVVKLIGDNPNIMTADMPLLKSYNDATERAYSIIIDYQREGGKS